MIRMSRLPGEDRQTSEADGVEATRVGPPVESMEVTPRREGNSLTTNPRGGSGRFIRTTLRPSLERTTRQSGRRVSSPMAMDSTVESVKVGVLLAGPPDGLVVLVSVPLVLELLLVLLVVLESQIRAKERKNGMNQLSAPIRFAPISQISSRTTMTRRLWVAVNPNTQSDDQPCPPATSTAGMATIEVKVMEVAVLEVMLRGTPSTRTEVTKILSV